MFKNIKLGIRKKGIVTIKYPAEPYKPFDNVKGLPKVDIKKCTKCAECVQVCPTNSIEVNEDRVTIDIGLCIFCGECQLACSSQAIQLSQEIELASKSKNNLKVVF
jgi:formate hydrogenlyase subunit 6/NADH:ubiquinone oxidoreductase subunit I